MFVPLLAASLMVQLVAARDNVPKFDVKPSCEGAARASYAAGGNDRLQSCMAGEQHTRDELAKDWSSYPAADRSACITGMHNWEPTYTELATCLEMKRDLRQARQKEGAGARAQARAPSSKWRSSHP
jgi:hypothetical protein